MRCRMNNVDRLKGIIPALITAYDAAGNIFADETAKLVDHLILKGVSGFYIGGTTGEGLLQSVAERKFVIETVLQQVSSRVPVIAHVGAMDTKTSIELAKHAAVHGATAISAVAPFYYKHSSEQIRQHYLEIVESSGVPLVIYHIPVLSGVNTGIEFYQELSNEPGIIGIKFTSRDSFELQQLKAQCRNDFIVFNGADEICLSGLLMGATGAIGSTYNIMPQEFIKIYDLVNRGEIEEAKNIQYKVNALIYEILKYDFIAFEREVLQLQGFNIGNPRKPIQQLSVEQKSEIKRIAGQYPFLGIN